MDFYLNDDTFLDADWQDSNKIRGLLALCRQMKLGHVCMFEECVWRLSNMLGASLTRDEKDRIRTLFGRPYAKSTVANNEVPSSCRLDCDLAGIVRGTDGDALPGRRFTWAHSNGGMLIGLNGSRYGNGFKFVIEVDGDKARGATHFEMYMVSDENHVEEPVVKRWLYAFNAERSGYASDEHLVRLPHDLKKHFVTDGVARGVSGREELRESTRSSTGRRDKRSGNALFVPEIRYGSTAYRYLVASMIRAAFEDGNYVQDQQNGFSADIGFMVGFANGKETRSLMLYITNEVVAHVRPWEHVAKFKRHDVGEGLRKYIRPFSPET